MGTNVNAVSKINEFINYFYYTIDFIQIELENDEKLKFSIFV